MRIRRALPSDLETIIDFNLRLAAESEGVDLDPARLRRGVAAVLGDESRALYFLAESRGGPVGQLALTYEWSDWRNGTFWWLQNVYVLPEHRQRGVLRALYEHVLGLASERGVCGVRLYVEEHNRSAQEVYRRLGIPRTVYRMHENDFVLDRIPPPPSRDS